MTHRIPATPMLNASLNNSISDLSDRELPTRSLHSDGWASK